jgi:predicted transcriptional regulator
LKKRKQPKTQASLEQFEGGDLASFLSTLTPKKIKIIDLLNKGYYGAMIARDLKVSRSYISKFLSELKAAGFIEVEWVNSLTRRATSYRVCSSLKNYLSELEKSKAPINFTLFPPHKLRYKYRMQEKTKPISTNTGRFAAAKVKHYKTNLYMRGGIRHYFSMKHDRAGEVGITVHPNSIEVYQRDRHHIRAASVDDATNQLAMALNEVAQRFVQEQSWENNHFSLNEPELVGSVHYAGASKLARMLTDAGQSQLSFANGIAEIDKSLEKKCGESDVSDLELSNVEVAQIIDTGLRNAANINEIVPNLVREELKSVSDQILGINNQAEKIDLLCNNVQALVQGGIPVNAQLEQLMGVVARQGETIHLMQQSMLGIIQNMEKLITSKQ